jgi:hypothetical protein
LLALVLLEAAAIALLGVLVAGLLRSHAEILRRLHELGAGLDLDGPSAARPPAGPPPAGDRRPVAGETPGGDVVSVALDRPGELTLLLFLSSGCGTCAPWWERLGQGLPGVRVVAVARDAAEESPSALASLAPDSVTVVMASEAWERFSVPGSPYAVLVDGTTGAAIGDGVARSWEQLASLVAQHLGDRRARLDGDGRERRADAELLAAGIHPGHPSLHPEPGSWTR